MQPYVAPDGVAASPAAELLVGAHHHGVVFSCPYGEGVIAGGSQPDRTGGPALVVTLPQHPADGSVDVVVEEEPHLPGRGHQVPGLIHVGLPQVGEGGQDRISVIAVP